ncbi:hypothetical protein [Paraclostridium bifermentans]|uniref:hypothetical protein n=1 Tax=Paraclostridium bifermentans TaxID=1490 RepID=UPI00374EC838
MIRLIGEIFKLCKEDENYEILKDGGYNEDEESYSLKIYFDLDGAKTLKSKIETAVNEGKSTITVDESHFLEKGQTINKFIMISKKWPYDGNIFEIDYVSNALILKMDSEVLESQIIGFNECMECGEFFPDEICEAKYKDTEIDVLGYLIQ